MRKIALSSSVNDKKSRSSVNAILDIVEHYNVDIAKLIPYSKQARKNFNEDEIKGLSQSIKEHGIRQPLSIVQSIDDPSLYEVVSGERRLRAAILLGMKKVPCIILPDYFAAEEIALIENIQRQNLHPIEMGDAFSKIINTKDGMTQLDLSKRLGISHKVISECVRFSELPENVKSHLIEKNITQRSLLRKLLKMEDPQKFLNEVDVNTTNKHNKTNVLRVQIIDGKLDVEYSALSELSDELKINLKIKLLEICAKV